MDANVTDQMINELFSSIEVAEAQSAAILQFLKDKGLATSEDLAPYLEQAGKASDVRSRAARLRFNSLLSSALKTAEDSIVKKVEQKKVEQKKVEQKKVEQKADAKGPEQKTNQAEERDEKKAEDTVKNGDRAEGPRNAEQAEAPRKAEPKVRPEEGKRGSEEKSANAQEKSRADGKETEVEEQKRSQPAERSVPAERAAKAEPERKSA